MIEIWKPILKFNNLYSISNLGRVRNDKTGRMIKSTVRKDGYSMTSVTITNPTRKTVVVQTHRLVLLAFNPISNPDEMHVHHINYNTLDNRLENLVWLEPDKNWRDKESKTMSYKLFKSLLGKYGDDILSTKLKGL
jgi:hypothetical protein